MDENKKASKSKNKKSVKNSKSENSKGDPNDAVNTTLAELQTATDVAMKYIVDPENEAKINSKATKKGQEIVETVEEFKELQNEVIQAENERLKMRLTRLPAILSYYLQDVNNRHAELMEKLEKWIGLRIDSENTAIESLVNHIQYAIEHESELNYRLVLEGENFLVDQDVIVHPMPDPIQQKPVNHAIATKGALTATQIQQLIKLLQSQNESGIIEYGSLNQIILQTAKNAYGQNEPILPPLWESVDDAKLYALFAPFIVPCESNKYVNWKLFVVSLMLHTVSIVNDTVAIPSLDTLFDLKQALLAKDKKNTGRLSRKAFGQVQLWFDSNPNTVWHDILFDVFQSSEEKTDDEQQVDGNNNDKEERVVPKINYTQMLYHMCFNDQSHYGFEKIVSLTRNVNIVDGAKDMFEEEKSIIRNRGNSANELELAVSARICSVNGLKQNNEIVESFNCVNIEQLFE